MRTANTAMNTKRILSHQRQFVKARNWDQFHTPKNLSMALAGEAAELMEIFQWLTEAQSFDVMENVESKLAVNDELADIFFYLMRLADVLGVDLEKAFFKKMKKNAKKYPVGLARGNAKKYGKLKKG